MVLCPRGVGASENFVCKGIVVPTEGAKLMVLFLLILGWSFLELLDRSVGPNRCINCNLHRKGDPEGVCRSLLWLSQFLSYEKERIQLFMALSLCTFLW